MRAEIRIKDAALEATDALVQSKDAVIDAKVCLIRRLQSESQLQHKSAAPPAAAPLQSAPLPPPAQSTIHGKKTLASGAVYEGELKDDKANRQGKCTFPNGQVYEGEWKNGTKNGRGKQTWSSGQVYVGEWKDGTRNGRGKTNYLNGVPQTTNKQKGVLDKKLQNWNEIITDMSQICHRPQF